MNSASRCLLNNFWCISCKRCSERIGEYIAPPSNIAVLQAYGRDGNRRSEGRRNFIEHTNYVSKDDGSKRIRIRYNVEGPYGDAFVFAEHSATSGLVYILVQDKRGGQIIPIVDNRSMLMSQALSGENAGMMDAMSKLLGGGSGGGGQK